MANLAPLRPHDRQFVAGALLMLVLLALSLAAGGLDPRLLDGVNVWTKPTKFAASLALHCATLAIFAAALPEEVRAGRLMAVLVTALLAATGFEMAYIMIQAAQAAPSHYNTGDPFHATMYAVMGVGAVILVVVAAAIGGLVLRSGIWWKRPGLRLGTGIGLIGGAVLTLIVAGVMSSGPGHHVGVPGPDAASLPLFGWSREVGDLRPAHFLALHAMQGLPLIGLAFDRFAPGIAERGTVVAALLWAAVTLAVFGQALAGLPLV